MKRAAVALIDEARCIGCTRCIDACPVDAIAGAQGFMHTVIAAYCTGCELCLPPCPVDCIALVAPPHPWTNADGLAAQQRARRRKKRNSATLLLGASDSKQRKETIAAAIRRSVQRKSR